MKIGATSVAVLLTSAIIFSSSAFPALAEDASETIESKSEGIETLVEISNTLSPEGDTKEIVLGEKGADRILVPDSLHDDVVIETAVGDISVGLPTKGTDGTVTLLDNGDAVVVDSGQDSGLVVQKFVPESLQETLSGIRFIASLESRDSDPFIEYDLDLPEHTNVIFHQDGTVELLQETGELVGGIGPAWAVDAQGKIVPSWYEYENGKLYQYVDHLSAQYAYPIVADPAFLVPLGVAGGRIVFQRVVAPALI